MLKKRGAEEQQKRELVILSDLVPKDHLLGKISKTIETDFIYESDVERHLPLGPKVALVTAMQANLVLELLVDCLGDEGIAQAESAGQVKV